MLPLSLPLPTATAQEDHHHDHGPVDPDEELLKSVLNAPPKKTVKIFRGYSKYRDDMKKICVGIYEDGRIHSFITVVKSLSERDPACVACRPLMTAFAAVCTSVVNKREKIVAPKKIKVVPTATPTPDPEIDQETLPTPTPTMTPTLSVPAQREPSPPLLSATSTFSEKIAEDKEVNVPSVKAFQKLVFTLRAKGTFQSKAETEYMDILSEYLYAPLKKVEEEAIQPVDEEDEKASTFAEPEEKVDDLFAE